MAYNNQNTKFAEQRNKICNEKYQLTYKGKLMRITLKSIKALTDVLQPVREHTYQHRLLCTASLSITMNGESKTFHEKPNARNYLSTDTEGDKRKLQLKVLTTCKKHSEFIVSDHQIMRGGNTKTQTHTCTSAHIHTLPPPQNNNKSTKMTEISKHCTLISLNISNLNSPI